MENISINVPLNAGTTRLMEYMGEKVTKFGENYAAIVNQQDIADNLEVNVRTIYRQLESLEKKAVIELETKRGRDGGTVVVFNKDKVSFKSHKDNPFTGTTKTAQEIKELYYPDKGTYIPDNRTPEEKARDKVRAKRRQTNNDKMNNDLRRKAYPDKDFFSLSENPKATYQTYMLSRAYNAVLISRIEAWKNDAERKGDEDSFKLAAKYYRKYRHYDVLKHEFMGTDAFNHFEKLRAMLEDRNYNMMDYMQNAFDTFIFLAKQGKRSRPPYVNTLHGGETLRRYEEQVIWKRDFNREHPYYATPGDVNTKSTAYPILTAIGQAYNDGDTTYSEKIENYIVSSGLSPKERVKETYYRDVVTQIKESDLEDIEKEHTLNYFNEKIIGPMLKNISPLTYIKANHRKLEHEDDVQEGLERFSREWYADRGAETLSKSKGPRANRKKVSNGYKITFSMRGSSTFPYVWRVIEEASQNRWNYKYVKRGLEKFSDLIPLTEFGDVNLDMIVEQMIPEETQEQEDRLMEMFSKLEDKEAKLYKDNKSVDSRDKLWYDIEESVIGSSLRDGQSVTEETL